MGVRVPTRTLEITYLLTFPNICSGTLTESWYYYLSTNVYKCRAMSYFVRLISIWCSLGCSGALMRRPAARPSVGCGALPRRAIAPSALIYAPIRRGARRAGRSSPPSWPHSPCLCSGGCRRRCACRSANAAAAAWGPIAPACEPCRRSRRHFCVFVLILRVFHVKGGIIFGFRSDFLILTQFRKCAILVLGLRVLNIEHLRLIILSISD